MITLWTKTVGEKKCTLPAFSLKLSAVKSKHSTWKHGIEKQKGFEPLLNTYNPHSYSVTLIE